SFTGNLTFKNSQLPEVARRVPLQRLLLETDSPFLSPVPRRGRRNEPAHVAFIAEKLAEVKEVPFSEVEGVTTENACTLFGFEGVEME
ncbi:MAG: hydrolase TatD, partial [Calditrichaeota bacterium]